MSQLSLTIRRRNVTPHQNKLSSSLSPLLQRLYISRGVSDDKDLQYTLKLLYSWKKLKNINIATNIICDAIITKKRILIVGDFDADGATSCALAINALNSFGACQPDYLVPDRFQFGYGLSSEIVELAVSSTKPDVLLTVDNGISSIEGVKTAKRHGIQVVITDHHLAGEQLPEADAIVNPNQPGCDFESKNIAGVGVIFYVMCAVRAVLANKKWFNKVRPQPNMAELLDLVALGTVADVVSLDKNNRILVHQGLQRIRAGCVRPGIQALIDITHRKNTTLTTTDIGFALSPRINAAGRLDDMSQGIELLLTTDKNKAKVLALQLDELNSERRAIENTMQQEAIVALESIKLNKQSQLPPALCFYQPDWHQGVIGIVASRIKEKTHRPVIAFAEADESLIKGSARSITGFHIRDALATINSRFPSLLTSFGGHAMAAGLTLDKNKFDIFNQIFIDIASEQLTEDQLKNSIITDGELKPEELTLSTAEMLKNSGPWGQNFPEPLFDGVFNLVDQKILKNKHLKLILTHAKCNDWIDAILFNADLKLWPSPETKQVKIAYRLEINEFRGQRSPQMILHYIEAM